MIFKIIEKTERKIRKILVQKTILGYVSFQTQRDLVPENEQSNKR